jgi:small-conductance mechanosensitive channel
MAKVEKMRVVTSPEVSLNWGELSVIILYPILLILILAALARLTRKLDRKFDRFREGPNRNLHILGFELLSTPQVNLIVRSMLRFYRIFIYLLATYLFTMIFFSFFPYTRTISKQMLVFVSAPFINFIDRLLDFIPLVVAAIVVFTVVRIMIRFIDFVLLKKAHELSRLPFISEKTLLLIDKLAKPIILIGGALFVLSYLPEVGGKVVTYSLAGIGVLTILSLARVAENVVADILISYFRPFEKKDKIQLGEFSGEVVDRNFMGVKVKTLMNDEIVIPNRSFLQSSFTRKAFNSSNSKQLEILFKLPIEIDPKLIEVSLTQEISQVEGLDLSQPYKVLISDLEDSQISYKVSAFCEESASLEEVKSKLYFKILELLKSLK